MTTEKFTSREIARLILLCAQGKADAEQRMALAEWLNENEANRRLYKQVRSHTYLEEGVQEYLSYDSWRDWKTVKRRIRGSRKKIGGRLWPYAAGIVLAVGLTFWLTSDWKKERVEQIAQTEIFKPGSSKARLVLENGQTIDLETADGQLCRQLPGEHFVNDGQELTYDQEISVEKVQEHTLQIPRGGEYKVVLADGTKIWLNAASELIYPEAFPDTVRKVRLTGEAYFEVAKNPEKPFVVVVGDMEVTVLGTSFNVSAYPNSNRRTTLVEGRVAVELQGQHVEILPGQQARETERGLQVAEVNVKNYIGWKERRFVYEDKLLGEVLEDLERWYDVEVFVVNDAVRDLHLTANLPKYENMDKVLKIIEYATCVKFELNGRTLVVRLDR